MSASVPAEFFRQLATYLEAGVPIIRALEGLSTQGPRAARRVSAGIAAEITRGDTFAEAVKRRPRVFSTSQIALIAAGEQSGQLSQTLARLAAALEQSGRFRRRLWISLLYPILVYHAGVIIVTGIRSLLNFSADGLRLQFNPAAGAVVLLLGFGPVYGLLTAFWLGGRAARRVRAAAWLRDRLVAFIPVLGALARFLAIARFARTLEGLYHAGVAVPRGLELAAAGCGNELLRRPLDTAATAVQAGDEPIIALTAALPHDAVAMLATGFESGHLDEMLIKIAETYEDRAANRARVLGIVAPLLLLFAIGAVLVFFIISIFAGYLNEVNQLLQD